MSLARTCEAHEWEYKFDTTEDCKRPATRTVVFWPGEEDLEVRLCEEHATSCTSTGGGA